MSHTLYQIHTRLWLHNLSQTLARPATLDDIPDAELSHLARLGFDWLYLLGVWQTGQEGLRLARLDPQLRFEIGQILPGAGESDKAAETTGFTSAAFTFCGMPFVAEMLAFS